MRIKHRKIFISGTAVAAAGVLGIGTLIQTSLSVQASAEMMPGIETIVDENSSEKPFRILELVNNSADAEIGYYVSGQEPYIKLYTWQYQDENGDTQTMHFSSLEEGLKKLPTAKLRQEFAANVRLNSDGEIDTTTSTGIRSASGFSGDDVPVSYSNYEEKYFLSSSESESDWTRIDFTDPTGNKSRRDEVEINGQYEENTSHTGDYTKGEQEYYPITGSIVDDLKEKYRENIQNFYFSESDENSRGSYDLDFKSVTNEIINNNLAAGENNTLAKEYDPDNGHFGLYENVYEDLTSVIVANIQNNTYTFPGEKTTRDESVVRKIYDNSTSQIAETPDFSAGDVGDSESINTASGTEEESTQAEFGSDTSSQSAASDVQTGSDVSFENSFSDSTVDAASDTDSDEWDVSESESDSADSGSDFGSDFSDEETDEAAVSTEDAGTGDAVDVVDDFSNDGSDGGSEIADTGDGSGNSTGDASEGETTSAEEAIGSTELANSIDNVRSNDTVTDENGKEVSPDTTGENPESQSNPYIYVSEQINVFPYYKYTKLGTLAYVKQKQTETEGNTERNDGDIVLENDQYYYYMVTADGTAVKYPLTVVTGRQPVSYQDIQKIPESLDDYYYRVSAVYFCCQESTDQSTGYKFTGWYYVNYQDQSNIYIKTESEDVATYYISDASYTLTPGTGDYDFVQDENADPQTVQVDHIYYKGGYTNNDWFKKYVFHLEPRASTDDEDGEFENFNIQVDTMNAGSTESSLEAVYAEPSKSESSDTDAAGQADDSEISVDDSTEEDADSVGENGSDTTQSDTEAEFSDDTEIAETGSESSIQDADDSAENNDEADVDAQADISIEEENADSAGDGASTDDAGTLEDALSEYDLIYVNGKLSTEMAKALEDAVTENTIPCIINNAKDGVANSLDTNMQTDFVKDASADTDGHYVNKYVYFFKNNLDKDSDATAQSQLLNVNFHTNFNDNADNEDNYEASEKALGFEEILKYIESENKYRALGGTNDTSQNSDSSADVSDGNTDGSTEGSSTDATNDTLDPLSREISQARAIEYIINYKYKRVISGKENLNVLQINPSSGGTTLSANTIMSWTGTNTESYMQNVQSVDSCCKDGISQLTDGNSSTYWISKKNNYNDPHWVTFELKEVSKVSGITYQAPPDYNSTKNGVPCELKVILYGENDTELKQIKFDQNQIGIDWDNITSDQKTLTFDAVSNVKKVKILFTDTYGQENGWQKRYASAAELGLILGNVSVTSMTATEFVGHIDDIGSEYDMIYINDYKNTGESGVRLVTGDGELRYTHVGAGNKVTVGANIRKLLGQLDNEYDQTWTGTNGIKRFAPFSTYSENGGGYFRGAGNDMTSQQCEELLNFVKSGYPVVLADGLVTDGRKVNTSEVDSASYYYEFINEALKYDNVCTISELNKKTKDIEFYFNLAKPVISFDKNGGKPKEPVRAGESETSDTGYINGELKYVFTVENDSDVAPASTTYDCNLYLDLNFDGNLSEKESQDKYITIQDENGNVLSQKDYGDGDMRYELKIGRKYTVIRKIPSDYFKLITWKLELTSNRNTYIHTSETGYAKQKNTGSKQEIKVLQLVPTYCTWNLSTSDKFRSLLNNVDDFDIRIFTETVSNIKNYTKEQMQNLLSDKQMLVIGFADAYEDIDNSNGQVGAILEFVKSGKSIIFAHDTTSYINFDKDKMYGKIASTQYGVDETTDLYYENWLWKIRNNPTWGLSLNSILRSVVGMDRYGITSTEMIGTQTVSQLLKKGVGLSSSEVSFEDLMSAVGDIAYTTGGDRTSSYASTQGYTNGLIQGDDLGQKTTSSAVKINDGAITQYPFRMGDSISVATTHGQYYQLAMEQDKDINGNSDGKNDVVVWYCLTGNIYSNSPKDVRNNYYFYSKGNVIYTGAGHSDVNGDEEIKLFINAMVAAANVTAVEPEVHFVKSLNPAAETETMRYYMTDQTVWTSDEENTLEEDMTYYINVKDYNMVSADLSQEDLDRQEMTVQFYIDDTNGNMIEGCPASGKVSDITQNIGSLTGYGNTGTVTAGEDNKFHLSQNSAYSLTVHDIEQYLRSQSETNGYKENCKLYVKVTSTVYLYGQERTSTKWASIDLKQRQLFEMD